MPLFNVYFTYSVFKRNPDDSQQKIERSLGGRTGIVADTICGAIAIAARDIPKDVDDETLSTVVVTAVQQKSA